MTHQGADRLQSVDASIELSMQHAPYRDFVLSLLDLLHHHDTQSGDLTSQLLNPHAPTAAMIRAKQRGILAGVEEATHWLRTRGLTVTPERTDGSPIAPDDVVLEVYGEQTLLLGCERIALNLLQRLSGIATEAARLTRLAAPTRIAATRKTLWGSLDKKAVSLGSGLTHRLSLSDALLIKDNHLALLHTPERLSEALRGLLAQAESAPRFVEIEFESLEQLTHYQPLLTAWATRFPPLPLVIMLDNFAPDNAQSTLDWLTSQGLRDKLLIELSGGITAENLAKYASLGADFISLGALTHSATALDLSLSIIE